MIRRMMVVVSVTWLAMACGDPTAPAAQDDVGAEPQVAWVVDDGSGLGLRLLEREAPRLVRHCWPVRIVLEPGVWMGDGAVVYRCEIP